MNKRGKKIVKNKPKITPIKIGPPTSNSSTKSRIRNLWDSISTFWKVIGGLFVVGGGILTYVQLYDRFLSPKEKIETEKEKYDKLNVVQGDLKPEKITSNDSYYSVLETPPIFTTRAMKDTLPEIKGILLKKRDSVHILFLIGKTALLLNRETVTKGVKLKLPVASTLHSGEISFGIRDDRLYVNVEFKDLLKEETIGWIEYNHWKIIKQNMLEYPENDDNRLEVRDKQNNIVFSIGYQKIGEGSTIVVNGYFLTPFYGISIISSNVDPSIERIDTCLLCSDANWKKKASLLINNIKTIFPKTEQKSLR